MRIFFLLLSLSVIIVVVKCNLQWKSCSNHADILNIEGVMILPEHPRIGSYARLLLWGKPIEVIDFGNVNCFIKGPPHFPPQDYLADLCTLTSSSCPLPANSHFYMSKTVLIDHSIYPGEYTVRNI